MSLGAMSGIYFIAWIIGINIALITGKMPNLIRFFFRKHKIALTIVAITFLGSMLFFFRSLM